MEPPIAAAIGNGVAASRQRRRAVIPALAPNSLDQSVASANGAGIVGRMMGAGGHCHLQTDGSLCEGARPRRGR